MDATEMKMAENLLKNTGKSLDEWKAIALSCGFKKHGEILNHLKTEFGLGHGFANFIVHKAQGSDAGSSDDNSMRRAIALDDSLG